LPFYAIILESQNSFPTEGNKNMATIPGNAQTLDVVIATYNRCDLLAAALKSLLAARRPEGLSISVTVVDNNSKDETKAVVQAIASSDTPFPIRYVFEPRQGRSSALNAGIQSTRGDLIGMIDDDEEVDPSWFEVIHALFGRPGVDFIGGPCLGNWTNFSRPKWIHETSAVLGIMNYGPKELRYATGECQGIAMGGNAVYRRTVFNRVGLYNVAVGRSAKGLESCEDSEMFVRVIRSGAKGLYVPNLVIHHYIPEHRLNRSYHRRWHFGHGISEGVMVRNSVPDTAELFGLPRWRLRFAAEGLAIALGSLVGLASAERGFEGEARFWSLMGYVRGKYFHHASTAAPATQAHPVT
jgi:glucosyl-dolichyl phosphate glucuronosyltransferase